MPNPFALPPKPKKPMRQPRKLRPKREWSIFWRLSLWDIHAPIRWTLCRKRLCRRHRCCTMAAGQCINPRMRRVDMRPVTLAREAQEVEQQRKQRAAPHSASS